MQYVYKYVNQCGDTIYIGITDNLPRRIREHTKDKLQHESKSSIYYFPVKNRADAEMLETYLISHYKTEKYYNVSKTKKGDVSFLGDIVTTLPWKPYKGKINDDNPFVVVPRVETVEKIRIVPQEKANADAINKVMTECVNKLQERIDYENEVIAGLKDMQDEPGDSIFDKIITKGIELHEKVLKSVIAYKDAYIGCMYLSGDELSKISSEMVRSILELNSFESEIKAASGWEPYRGGD